ncbi:4-oxalocrotonate tautomerase [Zoogloea sp.]|uniref:4-oxalocrotonate tautomerase n=1 Tax=Zoogloea sp. TaxID=49181 RepID=UPI0035B2D482
MPTLHIELFDGRTPAEKRELVEVLTRETCRVLGCEPSAVDILFVDVKRENWATGGVLWSERVG